MAVKAGEHPICLILNIFCWPVNMLVGRRLIGIRENKCNRRTDKQLKSRELLQVESFGSEQGETTTLERRQ